jgi:hypothetical protein
MRYDEFAESLSHAAPPAGLSPYLLALWHDRRGDWDQAHTTVQDIEDTTASWLHAYLHRKEGDESNARYWYRRAAKPFPAGRTLEQEWDEIARALLS